MIVIIYEQAKNRESIVTPNIIVLLRSSRKNIFPHLEMNIYMKCDINEYVCGLPTDRSPVWETSMPGQVRKRIGLNILS